MGARCKSCSCESCVVVCLAAALESTERLMAHWYQTSARHSRPAAAAAAMGAPGSTHSSAGSRGDPAIRGPGGSEGLSLPFSNHQQQHLPSQQRQQEQEQEGQHISAAGAVHSGGGGVVAPCDHVACSQQSFCLVEEMERLKRNYHGRSDQVGPGVTRCDPWLTWQYAA